MPPETRAGRPRLRILDGLRLLAALMVVSWHWVAFGHGTGLRPVADIGALYLPSAYGYLGVHLFFLISGFVISMSAVSRTVRQFAVSRVVRLYPAYWAGVLLTAAVITIWPVARAVPEAHVVALNMTMLQQAFGQPSVDAVYWTLFAELRFYLIFALIVVWWGVTYARALGFAVAWLALSAVTFHAHGLVHTLVMPDFAPFFIAGIALFLMHRYGPKPVLWALLAVCFAMCQRQAYVSARNNARFLSHPVPSWPVMAILGVFFTLMVVVALGWLHAGWRWLTVAGAMTYPIYLIHEYIGWTIMEELHGMMPAPVMLAGSLALMLVVSYLIHRYVESPVAPRLRRLLSRRAQPEASALTG